MRPDPRLRRGRTVRAIAIGLALACGALTACGDDGAGSGDGRVTDLSELEAKLVEMQEEKSPNLSVEGADCPDEVDLDEGSTFECTVTIEGVEAPYAVTLTEDNPEAETGSFHIEPAKAIIDVSIVVNFIQGRVDAGAEVDCGSEKVIVTDVGGTFVCTISGAGETNEVEMIVKDIEGTVAFNN